MSSVYAGAECQCVLINISGILDEGATRRVSKIPWNFGDEFRRRPLADIGREVHHGLWRWKGRADRGGQRLGSSLLGCGWLRCWLVEGRDVGRIRGSKSARKRKRRWRAIRQHGKITAFLVRRWEGVMECLSKS